MPDDSCAAVANLATAVRQFAEWFVKDLPPTLSLRKAESLIATLEALKFDEGGLRTVVPAFLLNPSSETLRAVDAQMHAFGHIIKRLDQEVGSSVIRVGDCRLSQLRKHA
jgi:hypothetical protein